MKKTSSAKVGTTTKKQTPRRRPSQKGRAPHKGRKHNDKAKGDLLSRYCFVALCVVGTLLLFWGLYYFTVRPYAYRWRKCIGVKEYAACVPPGYTVFGFDISRHQGDIRWDQLLPALQNKNVPLSFVYIKATEGGDFKDKKFDENLRNARSVGLACGAYHFFNPATPGERQARFFIETVQLQPGDLPPVVDVEVKPRDPAALRRELAVWIKLVEAHYGVKPIIYSSKKYKRDYLNDSLLNSCPYWMAHYYSLRPDTAFNWSLWQYTDVGELPGVFEDVDLDIFNGSPADFEKIRLK